MRVEVVDEARTRGLRRRVLRPGDAAAPAPGDGPGSVHLAALDDTGAVVGSAALLPGPAPQSVPDHGAPFQLRGMAVEPGLRGRGVGSALLRACLAEAATRGAGLLWCNARVTAVAFYERHGLRTAGGEFVSPATGVRHVEMWVEPGGATSSE